MAAVSDAGEGALNEMLVRREAFLDVDLTALRDAVLRRCQS